MTEEFARTWWQVELETHQGASRRTGRGEEGDFLMEHLLDICWIVGPHMDVFMRC